MVFEFNSYDLMIPPKIKICRLDKEPLGFLNATNIKISPAFASITELSFTCYDSSNLYDCIRKEMVLEVDGFGRFVITDVDEESDGKTVSKSVTANSYEVTLNKFTLTFEDNIAFKLWDETHPESCSPHHDKMYPSLLWVIQEQTGWIVRHVDASLINHIRTMSIDKEQTYGFMMSDLSDTYGCYFEFDTMNKGIYCYDRDETQHPIVNSGINLSFRNVIMSQKISEGSDDIVTALTVRGAEGVGINVVNPLGNDVIYDFSYYMNDEKWGMPKDLQDAVVKWQNKIAAASDVYDKYVGNKRKYAEERTKLTADISVEEGKLKSLLDVQAVLISSEADAERLKEINKQIAAQQKVIDDLNKKLSDLDAEIEKNKETGESTVSDLSFKSNFTPEQLEMLSCYINGSVYENTNFVYTDTMTDDKKIEVSAALYNQGLVAMAKLSSALYEYECDIVPFMFNKDYKEFSNNIVLGNSANLEIEEDVWITPRMLKVDLDYDNPENSKLILSDTFRLSGDLYKFSDDWVKTIKASRKSSASIPTWNEVLDPSFYSTVRDYMTNALDLTTQEIINSKNQEFTIGSYGLRGKKYDEETGTYDPCQIAITNNVLAFTDDNWTSTKAAIGKVKLGEPGHEREYYGVLAEAIFGNIIAGEHLTIEARDKQLVMDSTGCRLNNAEFTVSNDNTRIIISPSEGFKIQKKNGSSWKDVLSQDTDGYIVAKAIKIEESDIGGWEIKKDRLESPTGDYIGSDGTGKLSLMTWNPTQATFNGNIYANNLQWRYGTTDWESMFSALGNMPGGWLLDASVGAGKRTAEWDEIYADYAEFNKLKAHVAEIDELTAGMITTDVLAAGFIGTNELFFGGSIKIGANGNTVDIYGEQEYIDQFAPSAESLWIRANGHIHLETSAGEVKTGKLVSDSITATNGATFNAQASFNSGLKSDGDVLLNNLVSNNAYHAIGVKDTIDFRSGIKTTLNADNPYEEQFTGSTKEITIDGQTLKFVNGLLVN